MWHLLSDSSTWLSCTTSSYTLDNSPTKFLLFQSTRCFIINHPKYSGIKWQPLFYAHSLMSQEFGTYTAGIACLCSTVSGSSDIWRLGLDSSECLAVNSACLLAWGLGAQLGLSAETPTCGLTAWAILSFFRIWRLSSKDKCLKRQKWKPQIFQDLALENVTVISTIFYGSRCHRSWISESGIQILSLNRKRATTWAVLNHHTVCHASYTRWCLRPFLWQLLSPSAPGHLPSSDAISVYRSFLGSIHMFLCMKMKFFSLSI